MNNKNLNKHKELVTSMYRYFESMKSKPLEKEDLIQFYTPEVEMIINDHMVSQGVDEFYEHFKLMRSKPCEYSMIFPDNPMIAEDNRVAIQYKIEMKGEQYEMLYVMLYFTFTDGKISKWDQVVSKATPKDMGLTDKKEEDV